MGGLGLGPRRGTGHGHQQQVGEIGLRTGTEVGFYKGTEAVGINWSGVLCWLQNPK